MEKNLLKIPREKLVKPRDKKILPVLLTQLMLLLLESLEMVQFVNLLNLLRRKLSLLILRLKVDGRHPNSMECLGC